MYNFTYKNFAAVINKYQYFFNTGDIVAGTIFSIENGCILVDIGANIVGHLPLEELTLNKNENLFKFFQVNMIREFYILLCDWETNQIILSIKKIDSIKAWKRIRQIFEENVIISAEVIKLNRGGCIVQFDELKGFVPKSHLILNKKLQKNENIFLKILEFKEDLNYLLLSARCAYIQQNVPLFQPGKIIHGTVDSVQGYGLFIKFQGLKGLLHISEIILPSQNSIQNNFTVGQSIEAMIIHVDTLKGRITLSQKGIF
uniref:ribosomal protein S1 n=1 Tax=Rhodaphanes brevistipitata TaxID=446136 RepID=UPI001FCD44FC|nr:ribosomal protein S1 [Rhodaphanes brevistipitata]UNJ18540.1 ribosomal protein S1 [Rhodaphanes brevistipitata]